MIFIQFLFLFRRKFLINEIQKEEEEEEEQNSCARKYNWILFVRGGMPLPPPPDADKIVHLPPPRYCIYPSQGKLPRETLSEKGRKSGGRGIAGTCHSWDYDDIAEETPSARPALTHPRLTFPRIIKTLDNEISRWMCTISAGIGGDDIIINDSCRVIFFFFFFFFYSILWD